MLRAASQILVLVGLLAALGLGGCGGGGSTPRSPRTSAQPIAAPGGEASIEGYGSEASGSERSAILSVFTGYMAALAEADYGKACDSLASATRHQMLQLVRPGRRDGACRAVLSSILIPSVVRQQSQAQVTKVRVGDGRGFVVFHAPGAKLYQLPVIEEGAHWKLGLAVASILAPSAATLGR
jgi:hypothetical protein